MPPAGSKVTVTYNSGPHDGFIQFYNAIKKVNPSLQVCAEDIQPGFLQAMGTNHPYDCVGDHTGLSLGDPSTTLPTDQFEQELMATPEKQATRLSADQQMVDSYAGRHVPVTPTAYGHSEGNFPAGDPQSHLQLADGILEARQLQGFISLGVPQANRFMTAAEIFEPDGGPNEYNNPETSQNGIIQSDGQGHFVLMPDGLAMEMLSKLGGMTTVTASVSGDPSVALPDGSSIPALTVTSAYRRGTLKIVVVNSSMTDPVTADIQLSGTPLRGHVAVSTLNGASPESTNTLSAPNAVAITNSVQVAKGQRLSHVFPAHSVTLLTVKTVACPSGCA